LANGLIVKNFVKWQVNIFESESISARTTVKFGCRSLDILHIGIAVSEGFESFVSLDDRQIKVASEIGLNVVDLRSIT